MALRVLLAFNNTFVKWLGWVRLAGHPEALPGRSESLILTVRKPYSGVLEALFRRSGSLIVNLCKLYCQPVQALLLTCVSFIVNLCKLYC